MVGLRQSVCKHALLNEVDNDGGFYVGIPVGDLPCCKLSVRIYVGSMTSYYLIALPNM